MALKCKKYTFQIQRHQIIQDNEKVRPVIDSLGVGFNLQILPTQI